MSKLWIPGGGGFVQVPDGDKTRYCDGAAYHIPTEIRAVINGAFVSVWSKSNPITVTFYPSMATNVRFNGSAANYDASGLSGNNAQTDLYNGRFNSGTGYHYTSLLQFAGGSNEGQGTLAAIIGSRPVVKSASLRLHRVSGGLGSPAGNLRIGTWTQPNAQTLPATTLDGTYHDWDPMTVNDVAGWSYGVNRVFPVNVQQIYDLVAGKTLMFSEVISGYTTSGATTSAYTRIYGTLAADAAKLPLLTVTFDII